MRRKKGKGWEVSSYNAEHVNCVSIGVPKSTHIAHVMADSIHTTTKFRDVDAALREKGIVLNDTNAQRTYRALNKVKSAVRCHCRWGATARIGVVLHARSLLLPQERR